MTKRIIVALLLVLLPLNVVTAEDSPPALALIDNLSEAFEQAANIIKPSVVTINSIKKAHKVANPYGGRGGKRPRQNSPLDEFFGDEFFNKFFEFQVPENDPGQQGMGSGVIVSADGYILTNNHVVEGADEISVVLYNDKKFEAELVGNDPKSDLAVVKIKSADLVPARLGDSDKLKVGKWVVAVGNPFNLDQTITAGIVSAKGRSNVGITDYEDFIQTDAAINPGNSGGPLVNLYGEVIGINTAIFSRSGGYMGIGFAIPINMAREIMNSLIKDGQVVRGFIGVMIQKLDEDLAKSFKYEGTSGALVSEVSADSPAAKAGIKDGDILVEFNGQPINDPSQLRNVVGKTRPEEDVECKIFRDGKYKTLTVRVGKLESEEALKAVDQEKASTEFGLDVAEVTAEIAERYKLKKGEGVIVKFVEPGSAAQLNGIKPGDVIVSINGEKTNSTAEFSQVMKSANFKEGVRLAIRRSNGQFFLFLKE